jgi:ATP-dependent Zn protease
LSRAIARAAGLQWVKVSCRHWSAEIDAETWRSVGEQIGRLSALEEAFEAARVLAPSVLYIEDLGRLEPELAARLGRQIELNDSSSPVLVIGSALDDEMPDEECLKAANFEHTVYLPLPNAKALAGALRVKLGEVEHNLSDTEIGQVGRLALGGTAAELDLHLRRAQKIARRSARRPLQFNDLAAAILETPAVGARPKISAAELRVTAHHEAGHAVMEFLETGGGRDIQYLSVVPRRMGDGTAMGFIFRAEEDERYSMTRAEALARVRNLLGGRAAEEILLGRDHVTTGAGGSASSDLAKASCIATQMIARHGMGDAGDLLYRSANASEDPQLARQVNRLLRKQYRQTISQMRTNWRMVASLADRLLADLELSGEEVREALRNANSAQGPATP